MKRLIGISERDKMRRNEINRVKGLVGDRRVRQGWAGVKKRPAGVLFEEDELCCIPGIGKKVKKKIEDKFSINSVMEMASLSDSEMLSLSKICSININTVNKWRDVCQDMKPGKCIYPYSFDYVEGQANPYEHRYGSEWIAEIHKVAHSGLTKVTCVTDLIEHIDRETKEAYKDTQYKHTYRWSHDALTQMCDAACKKWMIEKGYWNRWVKPELGLNSVIKIVGENGKPVVSRNYKERPVGDSPELMPHDNSLNWDVDVSNNMHVVFTAHLPNSDERKMRRDTPKEISKAILKLYHPETGVVPKPYRIVQDILRVLYCLEEIVKAGGAVVPGLANRNGHRALVGNGGRRYFKRLENVVIASLDDLGIRTDVQEVAKEFMAMETDRFQRQPDEAEQSDLE
jgi:ribosomal protein S13